MNKAIFLILLILVNFSCNDDNPAPSAGNGSPLLTRISRNGVTLIEFLYDLDKKLHRVNYYAQGKLASYNVYEYSDKGLKELRRYDGQDHELDIQTIVTLDNFGRVIKGENYLISFEEATSIVEYEYNGAGQLNGREFRLPGDPISFREDYSYDGSGNLVQILRTTNPNQNDEYLSLQFDYTPGPRTTPDEWKEYLFILSMSGLDEYIKRMFDTSSHITLWNKDGEVTFETHTELSGQVYDENGNLSSQDVTEKNVLHPENPPIVHHMTFDYKHNN